MTKDPVPASETLCEWQVSGMDCASCAAKIKDAVGRLPGVSDVELGVMSERLKLRLDQSLTDPAAVEGTVRALGYAISARPRAARLQASDAGTLTCAGDHHGAPQGEGTLAQAEAGHGSPGHQHDDPADRDKRWWQTGKGRLVIGTALLLVLAYAAQAVLPDHVAGWAFVLACLIGVAPVARRAFAALRMGQPFTIESLMTVAALGALVINAAEEAAIVVFLFAVGEVLEGVAANKARDGIRALANLVPRSAWLETDASLTEVAAERLAPGQIVLVRPGDRVPADGIIVEGRSGVDDSPVTGESVPVTKGPQDAVFAGSINTEAALRVRVTSSADDNTIARIIRLVEEAEEARAPTERFIDRFSRWYMPAICAVAALVALVPPLASEEDWQVWLYRGLALLLIGCPCALVISVPAAIASALSTGARHGLLLKGGAVIEATAGLKTVAFDKTGTLTRGHPEVTDVIPLGGATVDRVLAIAAAVETGSSHPLARAVLARAEAAAVHPPQAQEARVLVGAGVEALVEGQPASVTSPRHAIEAGWLDAAAQAQALALEAEGKTVAVVQQGQLALGLIALRDEPRDDAAVAIQALGALGVQAIILTGDNPRTAAAIAGHLGTDYRAEMLPADKLQEIRRLSEQGGVMMVGDGINDAPALKQANVGVAMGSGTDVALETADAAILRDRVGDVPALLRLSRAAMANIRQNVTLALGLKAVFLVTSILGMTGLWIAILADTGATVLVTLNALRLLRFDPQQAR